RPRPADPRKISPARTCVPSPHPARHGGVHSAIPPRCAALDPARRPVALPALEYGRPAPRHLPQQPGLLRHSGCPGFVHQPWESPLKGECRTLPASNAGKYGGVACIFNPPTPTSPTNIVILSSKQEEGRLKRPRRPLYKYTAKNSGSSSCWRTCPSITTPLSNTWISN